MGSGLTLFSTFTFGLSVVSLLLLIYVFNGGFWQPTEVPRLKSEWWGPGKAPATDDTTVRPYKINVADSVLEDLNRRLDNTRNPTTSLEGVEFEYGFNSATLQKILQYWRKEYKWRDREVFLNKYPQFMTKIQGLDIHFLHVKPSDSSIKTVPLLLLHGWPGSVREFYSLIELLTNANKLPNKKLAFEIIAPSLPGYGFSSGAARPGLGSAQMAVVITNLMKRLGFSSWYVQGGDWGSAIGSAMSTLYPEHVKGFHSNFCLVMTPVTQIKTFLGSLWPSMIVHSKYQNKMYPVKKHFFRIMGESGYLHIQSTKPDTVGVGLNDSPAGLAAYILEKFSTWTNPKFKFEKDGGLTKKFTYDALLDNVMIYWVTNSITTSVRLYAENFSKAHHELYIDYLPITVPTACARFQHELIYQPDSLLKDRFLNLVQSTDYEDGGHFAAMEMPEVMAKDITEAVIKMETFKK